MFYKRGPERIHIEDDSSEEQPASVEFSSVEEIFAEKGSMDSIVEEDASTLAQHIERVETLAASTEITRENNEINKKRAHIQDIVAGHFVTLRRVPNDTIIVDGYIPILLNHIKDASTQEKVKDALTKDKFMRGIKSHAKSVLRACRRRERREVANTDMDPFSTMRIGASEILDANRKIDYCNLRWMPPGPDEPNEASPHLRLDLVQAKSAFPVAPGPEPLAKVKAIAREHRLAAEKFLNPPRLYEEFDDITANMSDVVEQALFDISAKQLEDYKTRPPLALLETIIAKNFPSIFTGETSTLYVDNMSKPESRAAKRDLRSVMVLGKELQSNPQATKEKLSDVIKKQVRESRFTEEMDLTNQDAKRLIQTACLQLVDKLDSEEILTEQSMEVHSVVDASDSRVVVGKDKNGNDYKRNVSHWQKRLTGRIDKNIFGAYTIETEKIAGLVREYDLFS